jgi:hypothetical protein
MPVRDQVGDDAPTEAPAPADDHNLHDAPSFCLEVTSPNDCCCGAAVSTLGARSAPDKWQREEIIREMIRHEDTLRDDRLSAYAGRAIAVARILTAVVSWIVP